MQIEEYGLHWNINSVDNVGRVLLKQGSGLVFRGRLEVHPFWGPYIQVNTAIVQKNTYWLIESRCFYAKQLETLFEETQIHLKKMIPWYIYSMMKLNFLRVCSNSTTGAGACHLL